MGLDITLYQVKKYDEENDDSHIYVEEGDSYPEWTKELEIETTIQLYDWDKYNKENNINSDDYQWHGESYDENGSFLHLKNKKDKTILKINLDNVPTYSEKVKVLGLSEIGYQRKGFNEKFYDDYTKGLLSYYVWSKSELLRYLDEYCESETSKIKFKTNIVDKFIEGEHCVSFDW